MRFDPLEFRFDSPFIKMKVFVIENRSNAMIMNFKNCLLLSKVKQLKIDPI
jgi:hypothetical protein